MPLRTVFPFLPGEPGCPAFPDPEPEPELEPEEVEEATVVVGVATKFSEGVFKDKPRTADSMPWLFGAMVDEKLKAKLAV